MSLTSEMRGIAPRTSGLVSRRRLYIFWEGISCIRFQYSGVFWRKLIKNSMSLTLEMRGIAPRSSGLISGRSTIWPTSHVYQISRNFFSLSQQLWNFSFRLQKISLLAISTCNRLSEDNDYHLMSDSRFVDAEHWSPYLSHAKRELYYLGYIPMIYNSRGSFCFSRQTRGWNFSWKVFLV